MKPFSANSNRPFFLASLLFFILVAIITVGVIKIDFTNLDVVGLLFLTTFVCCSLVAKSVYDSLVVNEQIARTEERIAGDITIASEELHTQLYQNSPVPYMLINDFGIVTSANLAAARLYGVAHTALNKKEIFETLHSSEPEHIAVLYEKFRTGIPVSDETIRICRQDGEDAWVLMSLFQFTNAYGTKIGLLTLVDITRQKQIENAKAEFVSLASHQLRTPIAGIKWSAELLQMNPEKNLNEKQLRYVDRLLVGVRRMAILVDDFLRVSRFELGTFQPEYAEILVQPLLMDIVKEQTEKVKRKDIVVKTFFDKELASIKSDPNLVRMILSNLFSNAVKYSKVGGTVHVGYGTKNDTVVFTVADNGIGIPIGDQERIFGKLFRASNAARNIPDGTGLGLYIAKEAVKVLKGKISFTSLENVSTTFEVVLPIGLEQSGAIQTGEK